MSPYREPSPRLEHWDDPQPGDLVREIASGAVGDITGNGVLTPELLRVFFDWHCEFLWPEDVIVIKRESGLSGRPAP